MPEKDERKKFRERHSNLACDGVSIDKRFIGTEINDEINKVQR